MHPLRTVSGFLAKNNWTGEKMNKSIFNRIASYEYDGLVQNGGEFHHGPFWDLEIF